MGETRESKVKIGIIGASGYAGGELLRLLAAHPYAEVTAVTSRSWAGRGVGEAFPNLAGCLAYDGLTFAGSDTADAVRGCDFVFSATPTGVAMGLAEDILASGGRLIDLGSDFRFRDAATYEAWHGGTHSARELLREAAYGLSELHREEIAKARVIGNPGCYPTATSLALAPLLTDGFIVPDGIIIDAKSGVSGAGRSPGADYHFPECDENLKAYKVAAHRHTPEIEQELSLLAGRELRVVFTPHLIPMSRGMLVTAYARLARSVETADLLAACRGSYAGSSFVRVLDEKNLPQTKAVAGSNRCDLTVRVDGRTGTVIALSAIDNLVKGAAGQAVQNLNIMAGWPEETALPLAGLWP